MVRKGCPRYSEAVDEVLESDEVKQVLADNAQLLEELTKHSGMPIKTPEDVQSLYGTLRAESEYGLKLPAWTKDYYPKALENLTELSYIYNVQTDEMKTIKAGPFLKKMSTEFDSKRKGTLKDLKISLYTGHDSTIVNILAALDVWKQQQPVYGIMALFELVEDKESKEIGVQIYLRNSATSGAIPLTIPGCDHFCPLDKFLEVTKKYTPEDRKSLCTVKNPNYVTPPPSGP